MSLILLGRKTLLVKLESTAGVFATPTASDKAVDAENITIQPESDPVILNAYKSSMGASGVVNLNPLYRMTFDVAIRVTNAPASNTASGALAEREFWDALVRASGLTPTYTASEKIVYTRSAAPSETISIQFEYEGCIYKLAYCVGDMVIEQVTGKIGYFRFTMLGQYQDPISGSLTSVAAQISTLPVIAGVGFSRVPEGHFTAGALKGLYFFNRDVTEDISSNSNTLTNNNTVLPVDVTVRGIGAAFTAASSQSMSRAYDADIDFAAASFAEFGWLKLGDTSGGQQHVTDRRGSLGYGWQVYVDTNGKLNFKITSAAGSDTITSITSIDDGSWHFFVVRKNGTTGIYLDIDGSAEASDTSIAATGSISSEADAVLYIGKKKDSTEYYNGSMLWIGILGEDISDSEKRADLYRWYHDYLRLRLTLAFGNRVFVNKSEFGARQFRIVDWAPRGSMSLYYPTVPDRNIMAEAMTNNPYRTLIQSKIGDTTANRQVILQMNAQFLGQPQPGADGNLRTLDVPFVLVERPGTSNTQLTLTVK